MKGIQVRWPRRPWYRASPSNPATRKHITEMVADIHTEVRRCTVMLYPHPLTNSQGYASLQCGCPQLSILVAGRWIGNGGPIPWPARSPDQNPLHYFLWEYLKSLVFETPVETDKELVARIEAACDIIQNTSGIFVRVRQYLVRRCLVYIEVGGCQFEQLL